MGPFREEFALLNAIASGRVADAHGESDVTSASLGTPQPFTSAPPAPRSVSFSFSTALDDTTGCEEMAKVGFPITDRTPTSVSWWLGLPKDRAVNHAIATIAGGTATVEATVGSTSATSCRIAHNDLKRLARLLRVYLSTDNQEAQYAGPQEFAS